MSEYKIYLSGAINGLTIEEANEWRIYVQNRLPEHIKCLNPFRGKIDYLKKVAENRVLENKYYESALVGPRGITCRDRFDATRCDVLFVNLLGAKKVSIGTVMEIAWTDMVRKPIILVMEKSGNIHEHPILTEVANYRVDTLDDGISIVKAILTP